ncbi:MAG: hypothetical protein KAW45_00380 [Thermoplasmatales archaeon]|nr:hypothetical protein [Thermoplasmatales archaeon]
MDYVCCGSHLPLLFALSLKNQGKDISVVTFSEDIIKFCKSENINHIPLEYIMPSVSSINKVFTLKKMLDKIINQIDDGKENNFYITGQSKAIGSFYLAKELSKRGWNVYFTDSSWIQSKKYKNPWYKPIFIRGEILRTALKLFLGLDLKYFTGRGIPFFGIDEKIREKYNIKDYPLKLTHEELIIEVSKNTKSNYKKCENLILDQGSFGDILKPGTIKNMYENMIKIPVEYTFKKHPGSTAKDSLSDIAAIDLFKNYGEVPRYIPVELLFNNIEKSVISVFSAPLITASHFDHLKSISLIELVEFNDDSYKKKIKDNLVKKSNNKILFPTSFEELNSILKS